MRSPPPAWRELLHALNDVFASALRGGTAQLNALAPDRARIVAEIALRPHRGTDLGGQ